MLLSTTHRSISPNLPSPKSNLDQQSISHPSLTNTNESYISYHITPHMVSSEYSGDNCCCKRT
ncbi:hypothetical protein EPI10_027980 [Gossypium australe]|uniref:Uncharacterized protein n=1 Tax=Gossypium australe TaxID=47621 RepID=A0A5B6UVV9_9ROSI|nr:hypothetical protein EPI10_027980 [Gossypium australe]